MLIAEDNLPGRPYGSRLQAMNRPARSWRRLQPADSGDAVSRPGSDNPMVAGCDSPHRKGTWRQNLLLFAAGSPAFDRS
jgi:hypothetical protein